jgi:hypothetical protein
MQFSSDSAGPRTIWRIPCTQYAHREDCLRLGRRRFAILYVADLPKDALDSIDKLLKSAGDH